jgi:hypothetical protein
MKSFSPQNVEKIKNKIQNERGKKYFFRVFSSIYYIYSTTEGFGRGWRNSRKARRGKEKVMLQKCYKTQKPLEKKSRLLYYNRTGLSMGVTRPNSPENN